MNETDTVKCAGCGKEIPADSFECPNCGRKRKWVGAAPASAPVKTPFIAHVCSVLGGLALFGGALALVGGISDSMNPHVMGGGAGSMYVGFVLLLSCPAWFVAARVITLLAEIAANTRK